MIRSLAGVKTLQAQVRGRPERQEILAEVGNNGGGGGGSGGGFWARLKTCRDAHGIVQVARLGGYLFSDTPGESPTESETLFDVQCPPWKLTQLEMMCYVEPAADATPPWVLSDRPPWYPRVPAAEPDPAPSIIESGEKGPFQYSPPGVTCE